MANFILIQSVFGLTIGDVFFVTADPNIYQSRENENALLPLSTIQAFPEYFLTAVSFSWEDKAAGYKADQVDEIDWEPAASDYFSTYHDELDLWKILAEDGDEWTVAKLTGNLTGITNPTNIAKTGFTDGRFKVLPPAEAEE